MSVGENQEADRSFSGVVLAGGQSRRMGQDKARLDCGGVSLIERQLGLLKDLGSRQTFIAARSTQDYPDLGIPVLADGYPGQGPLAGLERALQVAQYPLVLVLAVDLPRITAVLLSQILQACGAGRGVVPRVHDQPEPLAACYPKAAHGLAVERLDSGQNSARAFALACADRGLVKCLELPNDAAIEFANWNRPEDASA
jgi:molybdopterin-guanine dinucleotide biosynthesis protein A